MSYEVMTPSAARGLIESIYWHPGLQIKIDRIYVLNQIQYTNIRRNEVKSKASLQKVKQMMSGAPAPMIVASNDIMQRASLILRDVHYVLDAHFEITEKASPSDNEGKFKDIFRRRLEKGETYSQPYFGCREFPANFRAWKGGRVPTCGETKNLGLMLYDMDYSDPENIKPMFFMAILEDGVMQIAGEKVLT
jgi:CRISPR-associated protein Cas5d